MRIGILVLTVITNPKICNIESWHVHTDWNVKIASLVSLIERELHAQVVRDDFDSQSAIQRSQVTYRKCDPKKRSWKLRCACFIKAIIIKYSPEENTVASDISVLVGEKAAHFKRTPVERVGPKLDSICQV